MESNTSVHSDVILPWVKPMQMPFNFYPSFHPPFFTDRRLQTHPQLRPFHLHVPDHAGRAGQTICAGWETHHDQTQTGHQPGPPAEVTQTGQETGAVTSKEDQIKVAWNSCWKDLGCVTDKSQQRVLHVAALHLQLNSWPCWPWPSRANYWRSV